VKESLLTVSVTPIGWIISQVHNPAQSGFESRAYKDKTTQAKRLKYFILVRDERLEHYMFSTPIGWIISQVHNPAQSGFESLAYKNKNLKQNA